MLRHPRAAWTCGGLVPNVFGTPGADVLVGGPGRDVIVGGRGNDTIDGGGGDDVICGGAGQDDLSGAAGDDVVHGNSGDDVVRGGAGDDRLFGEDGADAFDPGLGVNRIVDRPEDAARRRPLVPTASLRQVAEERDAPGYLVLDGGELAHGDEAVGRHGVVPRAERRVGVWVPAGRDTVAVDGHQLVASPVVVDEIPVRADVDVAAVGRHALRVAVTEHVPERGVPAGVYAHTRLPPGWCPPAAT